MNLCFRILFLFFIFAGSVAEALAQRGCVFEEKYMDAKESALNLKTIEDYLVEPSSAPSSSFSKMITTEGKSVYFIKLRVAELEDCFARLRTLAKKSQFRILEVSNEAYLQSFCELSFRKRRFDLPIAENFDFMRAEGRNVVTPKNAAELAAQRSFLSIENTGVADNASTAEIIKASSQTDLAAWLKARELSGCLDHLRYSPNMACVGPRTQIFGNQLSRIDWKLVESGITTDESKRPPTANEIAVNKKFFLDYVKRFNDWGRQHDALVCLVPVDETWKIPAFFKFGGWDMCPTSVVHTAFLKKLHEKYGAEVVALGINSLTIELASAAPANDIKLLARDLSLYSLALPCQSAVNWEGFERALQGTTVFTFNWEGDPPMRAELVEKSINANRLQR